MPQKEIAIGAVAGIIVFLLWQGVDIVPLLFALGLVFLIFFVGNSRMQNKPFSVRNTVKSTVSPVKLDDIGGQEVAKNELKEALDFVINTESLKQLGIRPLKGILLNGPPGTGKTLLAKAAAHYTDSVFVAASGSEFVEMYVGVGAQRIRQLFQQAKELAKKQNKASAVIFIDEIEVLGGKRGQANSHLEHEQTLNELLVQMDGMSLDNLVKVLIIGATNRVDMLDPALLRPGRFDRQVKVDLPDKKGRLHILKLHSKNKPIADDVNLEDIADNTTGFSGAHLESLTNEAAILALREGLSQINSSHLRSAIDKVIMGEKLDRIPNSLEKKRIAVHEAGHALISELERPGSVASINVTSRSNALGYVRQVQAEDTYLYTYDMLRGQLAVALAGAVAEDLILGSRSTGAANDFKQAAQIARQITASGMSDLGIVAIDDMPPEVLHNTLTKILQQTEDYVRKVLLNNQAFVTKAAAILVDQESLTGEQFREILLKHPA